MIAGDRAASQGARHIAFRRDFASTATSSRSATRAGNSKAGPDLPNAGSLLTALAGLGNPDQLRRGERYRQCSIPEEAAPQFLDDAAPRNGMMPPPNSEMIAPPITE